VLKNIQIVIYIKMRSPEAKRRNCIISKENFIYEKMTEKILGKFNCYEFVKFACYKFQPNYLHFI